MRINKRIFSFALSACLALSLFPQLTLTASADQDRSKNFLPGYTVTGDGAADMIDIATKQLKRTGSQLGYSEEWCADFVVDCARIAGQTSAIPAKAEYANVGKLYSYIISAGGTVTTSNPQKGDICFIDWPDEYGNYSGSKDHVEIVYDTTSTTVKTIGGNTGTDKGDKYTRFVAQHELPKNGKYIVAILRPKYEDRTGRCTITFHPNGANEAKTTITAEKEKALGTIPTPSWSGMNFEGWYTAPFGGTQVTASTVPTGDMTLYGHWAYAYGSEVKLEYDTNGGTLPGAVLSRKIDGINIRERPEKALIVYKDKDIYWSNIYGMEVAVASDGKVIGFRDYEDAFNRDFLPDGGFVLSGNYYWDSSVGADVGGSAFVTQIKNLMDKGDVYVTVNYETGMVKVFDSYTGYLAETKMGQAYTTYGVLPVPTRSGYVFTGWEADGIDANYYSSFAGKYLTAYWTPESQLSPEATTEYDGRRYELYDDIVSWSKAKALCESMGGHLVTITDSGEQAAVKALITQGTRGSYKIGATDQDAEGNWQWVTGEEFSYENWDPDYPEPSGGSSENYAGIIAIENPPYKNVGEWIDSPNVYYGGFYDLSNTGFICEYDGPPKYELTYHYGISENKSDTYEVDAGDVMVTSVPYAFGYNCLGWSTNPTATTVDYLPYENITITEDTALYAVWEVAPVIPAVADQRVTIDGNFIDPAAQGFWHKFTPSVSGKYLFSKGTGSGDSFLYVYDENEELLAQSFKNYYTVLDIEAGKTVFVWTTCENASETTDFWVRVTREVNVSFDANGGSGAPDEYASVIGEAYFVSDAEPNKSGYTFLGWSTDKNATTAQYHAGDEITMTGDVTLYAVWECEHSYDYRLTKKPDLTTEGSMVGTCSTCYATTEAITLPKLNTTDYTYQEIKAATCTEAGSGKYTWKTTTYGSFGFDVVLEKLGHTYTDVVTAPNCTEKGYTTHTCACGDSYVDTYVDATGHKWDSSKVTTAATCTKDGVKTYTCTACKETKTEVIPATDHSYTAVVTAPNCTEKGYTTHTCSCGKSYVDSYVDATGHNHEAKRTEPTCSEPGYITYICACGDSYMGESIPSPGHNWDSGKVTTAATCTQDGVKTYTCSSCKETRTEAVPAKGHTYQNGLCTRCSVEDPNFVDDGNLARGICGNNLQWKLSKEYVLTISGSGDMYNMYDYRDSSWHAYRKSIKKVIIEDGVTSIGNQAFYECAMQEIVIPDSVTSIGNYAFNYCTKLQSIVIPDGVEIISAGAFACCQALTDVVIPDSVKEIQGSAFDNCGSLISVVIPDSVTLIGSDAFLQCFKLASVTLPGKIKLYSDAFSQCSNLKEIVFTGDAPAMCFSDAFYGVTATAYYPAENSTWTAEVMKDYGGKITWVAVESGNDEEITITINSTVGTVSAPEGGWKEGTNTFTVAAEKACVVAVSYDGGSTYVRLAASATGTANTYSFTADDITADSVIAVAMTGDTNKDGKLTNADITRMKAAYQSKVQLDGLTQLVADVNNSGGITNADVTKLKAVYQNKTTFAW